MSDAEDDRISSAGEGADDLFGDDDAGDNNDNEQLSDEDRPLSDHGLESDREEEEEERYGEGYEGDDSGRPQHVKTKLVMGVEMYRHRIPKPEDGKLYSLRVPPFIKWNPQMYDADTFEPSKAELEESEGKNPSSVARFRKDPKTGELQSNAVFYKWSDGSVTLAIGDEHFEVQTKSLAPPSNKPYQELQDAHYYVAAAHLASNSLLVVGHVSEQYSVRPNKMVEDTALKRLTDRLKAATKNAVGGEGDMIIRTTQDPELQNKQAELAEKERERARRKRENATARMEGMSGRYGRGGALSVGDLEGGRRAAGGAGRKRGAGGPPRQKRRRPEYDSDDDLPHGAHRNEEYDLADDFIAPSDEEISQGDEDEDEELLDDDEDEEEEAAPRRKRQKTAEAEDEDADADADLEDDVGPSSSAPAESSRRGRRHIIEDDDEE